MRFLINLSIIKGGGGLQVASSFINELKAFPEHQYCVLTSPYVQDQINISSFPNNFSFHLVTISPSNIRKRKRAIREIKTIETDFHPNAVFTLFGPSYWRPKTTHLCGYALPHFIYPESPFFKLVSIKEKIKWKSLGFLKFVSLKNECDYYVTETEDASLRLIKKLNISKKRVFTVNNAYNGIFNAPHLWIDSFRKTASVTGFKLITISSFNIHKNLNIIPSVIDYISAKYPNFDFTFILTIDAKKFPNLTKQHRNHILFLGKVNIEECPGLYQQADTLFMPTLLECFTVSYLEAIKMEKPILTSNLPFAHDICADAASYFDPMSPEDIGEKIVELAKNKELQSNLVQKGKERLKNFGTAADRAKSYLQILEKIATDNAT